MGILPKVAAAASLLLIGSCTFESPRHCERLSRSDALRMAQESKTGMLRRSTAEEAAKFASDKPVSVKIGSETNGYAADVTFRGRDGTTLIALIDDACHVDWTER